MAFQLNLSAVKVAPVTSGFVRDESKLVKSAEKSASEGAPDIITAQELVGSPMESWNCDAISISEAVKLVNSVWNDEAQTRFDEAHPNGYTNGKGEKIDRILVAQGMIDYNAVASATNLQQTPNCTIRQFKLSEDAKGRYLNSNDVLEWAKFRLDVALVNPGTIFKGRGKKVATTASA